MLPALRVTYAQNREDLLLAGLLDGVSGGFYVDVGANHPDRDSVTRLFYERGWQGINIEPNPQLHRQLAARRPRDVNLPLGLASAPGTLRLRCYPELDGLSTFSRQARLAMLRERPAAPYHDIECEVTTLAAVLTEHRPGGEVHFLKIDVDGLELEVLAGNDWERHRPWVLCIERNLDPARQAAVRALLAACRYEAVFDDGINDYWLAAEHDELRQRFSYAATMILGGLAVRQELLPRPLSQGELLSLDGESFVDAAYLSILRRVADPAGKAHYLERLAQGISKADVVKALASSDEARQRGLGADWLRAPAPSRESRGWRRWLGRD